MARKKVNPNLQTEKVEFDGMFPFTLAIVYKKGASIVDIIDEAADTDENLIPLANNNEDGSLSLVYKMDGTTVAYIIVDDNITIDTIVHESIHITCRLFEIIGSAINEDTEEFFAYLTSHMFRKVYKVVTTIFNLAPKMIYAEN